MKIGSLARLALPLCALVQIMLGANLVMAGSPGPEVSFGHSTHHFQTEGGTDAVTIFVDITAETNPVLFRWTYEILNHSYNPSSGPFLGNGFSGFHLDPIALMLPEEFVDMTAPSDEWVSTWECCGPTWFNQFGTGIMPGYSSYFSFATQPRLHKNADGYYYTHIFGAPVGAHYFPSGAGPLGPGEIVQLPNPQTRGEVWFPRNVPPEGYCASCPPGCPQPPLDYDLNGDGTPDSWNIPFLILGPGSTIWPDKDELGNEIVIVGKPGSVGLGCSGAHYSAILRVPGGNPEGVELGQCVYPQKPGDCIGVNSFSLEFEDANGNGVPDRFTKSKWVSRNGTDASCPKELTYFIADLIKKKIVVAPVSLLGEQYMIKATSTVPSILDAVIVDLGTELSTVVVNGDTLGVPGQGGPGEFSTNSQVLRVATRMSSIEQDGADLTIQGTLANYDVVGHEYRWATFGIRAAVDTLPPLYVAPDSTEPYVLQATLANPGAPDSIGVMVFAYAETGDLLDADADAILFESQPATDVRPVPGASTNHLWIAPNPFTSSAKIEVCAPLASSARVEIFDAQGRMIRTFNVRGTTARGSRQIVTWDGRNGQGEPVASGTYLCRLVSSEFVETRILVLIR